MHINRKAMKRIIICAGLFALACLTWFLSMSPTNEGPWKPLYAREAEVSLTGNELVITNFRRARYDDKAEATRIHWGQKRVRIDELRSVWFGLSVFDKRGFAHTFLSFDFGDGDPVVISIEARQRPDQSYGVWAGMARRFSLIYIMADERDILGVRSHKRGEEVFFHPLTISKERGQKLFLDLAERVNKVGQDPDFYNTLTSNCTNLLLEETTLPAWRRYFDLDIILPARSDKVAQEFGVINVAIPLENLRDAARVDPLSVSLEDPQFSEKIRRAYHARLGL